MGKAMDDFLGQFRGRTQVVARAVIEAGNKIRTMPRRFEAKSGEGHRSGITAGDKLAQKMMTEKIFNSYPQVRFLCEEEWADPISLSRENPFGILEGARVIIDPVDSTLHYGQDTGGWSVLANIMSEGNIIVSVVYAPAINDGLLVIAEEGKGVHVYEWNGRRSHVNSSTLEPAPKDCIVRLGVDTLLYPNVISVVPEIAANVRGMLTTGSGGLGLALLACQRAHVVIQTPQKAWDWATAYRAVIEGGSVFRFFRFEDEFDAAEADPAEQGKTQCIVPVAHYDFDAFRLKKNYRLGFVAGRPKLVEKIWSLLPKTGWARTNSDTTSGSWS